jgi:hypothetical protein
VFGGFVAIILVHKRFDDSSVNALNTYFIFTSSLNTSTKISLKV